MASDNDDEDDNIICKPVDSQTDLSSHVKYNVSLKLKGLNVRLQPGGWEGCSMKRQLRYLGNAIAESSSIVYGDREYRLYLHLWMSSFTKIYAGVFLQLQDIDDSDCIPMSVVIKCITNNIITVRPSNIIFEYSPKHPNMGFDKCIKFRTIWLPDKLDFEIFMMSL